MTTTYNSITRVEELSVADVRVSLPSHAMNDLPNGLHSDVVGRCYGRNLLTSSSSFADVCDIFARQSRTWLARPIHSTPVPSIPHVLALRAPSQVTRIYAPGLVAGVQHDVVRSRRLRIASETQNDVTDTRRTIVDSERRVARTVRPVDAPVGRCCGDRKQATPNMWLEHANFCLSKTGGRSRQHGHSRAYLGRCLR